MKDFGKEFQVLNTYTYLNTAASGILSNALVKWRTEHDSDFAEHGSVFREKHKPHIESVRSTVARFFKAEVGQVALVPNFSFGFNALLEGLPKKQKVLLLDRDYPSVNWAVEQRDFEVCYAKIDACAEGNIAEAIAKHAPDVFAFSLVQYLNGIKIDMKFLRQLKTDHPDLLLIGDATQFLGTEPFDFKNSPLDIVGASGYKWLLAGYGNGFFMMKAAVKDRIFPKIVGFNSAESTYTKRNEIDFISCFEPGHQDTLNYGSLEQSLRYLEELGMDWIGQKNRELSGYTKKRFSELGWLEPATAQRESHGTIFNVKGNRKTLAKLKASGVICSYRGGGIRVSPHFYNSEEDIEKLIEALK